MSGSSFGRAGHGIVKEPRRFDLLRPAVEGLTAERQNLPDYTATFTSPAAQLGEIKGS